jgi:hypothetical protein
MTTVIIVVTVSTCLGDAHLCPCGNMLVGQMLMLSNWRLARRARSTQLLRRHALPH